MNNLRCTVAVDLQIYNRVCIALRVGRIAWFLRRCPTCKRIPKKIRILINCNLAQENFAVVVGNNLNDQCFCAYWTWRSLVSGSLFGC